MNRDEWRAASSAERANSSQRALEAWQRGQLCTLVPLRAWAIDAYRALRCAPGDALAARKAGRVHAVFVARGAPDDWHFFSASAAEDLAAVDRLDAMGGRR